MNASEIKVGRTYKNHLGRLRTVVDINCFRLKDGSFGPAVKYRYHKKGGIVQLKSFAKWAICEEVNSDRP